MTYHYSDFFDTKDWKVIERVEVLPEESEIVSFPQTFYKVYVGTFHNIVRTPFGVQNEESPIIRWMTQDQYYKWVYTEKGVVIF